MRPYLHVERRDLQGEGGRSFDESSLECVIPTLVS